jgi:uridine nucleosidase
MSSFTRCQNPLLSIRGGDIRCPGYIWLRFLHEIISESRTCSNGLEGITKLPPASVPAINGSNAILALREALLAQPPKTAWPVATELLTNAALLFATFQELVDHVSGLNIMEATVRGGFTEAKNDKTDGSRMK